MDTSKNKQELIEQIARYEEEINQLKDKNEQFLIKIENFENKHKILEETIDVSSRAIIIGNKKGQIVNANQKALKMSRYNYEEICLKNINELLINENSEVKTQTKSKKDKHNQIKNEQILIRKDGKKLFVLTKTRILQDGQYQVTIKSINKRKNAEIAFKDVQDRYRQLAESINDAIWTATNDLKIKYISSSITKITGFVPEIYYQKPLEELLTPISYQLLVDTVKKVKEEYLKDEARAKKNLSLSIEIKLLQKHHPSIWVELTAGALLNHFDEIIGFQGIIKNIDTQKKTLEILSKNNQKYNLAVKSIGSGVWELNADLTRINIDDNLLQILGYQKNELRPLLNDWVGLTYKEDRILIIDILQDILDGKKISDSYECRRLHKNGTMIWFSDYVEGVYDTEGKLIELFGTSKNITKEKITEEKKYRYYAGLQMMIESTFQFLKCNDLDQIYHFLGQKLLQNIPGSSIIINKIDPVNYTLTPIRHFGTKESGLTKKADENSSIAKESSLKLSEKAFKLLSQKFLIEFKDGFGEFLDKDKPDALFNKIQSIIDKNRLYVIGIGSANQLSESISIIIKENTELQNKEFIEAFISLASIIIDKKKIEIELKKTNETKDKFFSIISHDLKNPFNTFIGFSSLIIKNIDKFEKEKILAFTTLINEAARQSYEMMQNLFEWVNSMKGAIKCTPVKIDIHDIVKTNIKLFSSEATKKEITLDVETLPEAVFYADKDMLNTIFRNLISNALKFTNNGGKVIVSGEIKDQQISFSVSDNGIGIPPEKQRNLFTLNLNKSTTGTNKEKGTGLGLLLCDEFIKLHNGNLTIKSEEGKGSVLTFTLPLNQ